MARIVLTRALRKFAEGEAEFDLEVSTIHALFRALGERYPAMKRHLDEGVAVAIDGQIYQDALFEPIPEGSEVHIIPQIAGG
ncbi:MAG: MoaD/ThiS family protein [Rhizobiales bacterium]|nr:MoaD/ThiS family protein [Hyphomicrobiales bacterium]